MRYLEKPIAVSMGEPSGVASELIIKAWLKRKIYKIPPFILVDDLYKLTKLNKLFKLNAKFRVISKNDEAHYFFHNEIPVIDIKAKINLSLGNSNKKNNKYVIESIKKSFELVYSGQCSSLITLPVCKKTLKKDKFNFNGQTEFLSHLTKKKSGIKHNEIMILSTTKPVDRGVNLIVGLVTTHIPLSKIHKNISKKVVLEKIISFKKSLEKIWKVKSPKIAVTSINPHAGEGGLIGNEEIKTIKPILNSCKKVGIKVIGPISADSCFHKKSREKYDGILCFYHDQGLIPVKTIDFNNSINVTGGLPFLRVSPDHGPAFDIAGQNKASVESLIACFKFLKEVPKNEI